MTDDIKVVQLRKQGFSIRTISELCDIAMSTVERILKDNGLTGEGYRPPDYSEQVKRWAKMRDW